jgi:hypothetical protein
LRAALQTPKLTQLSAAFRADAEHALRSAPVARGVMGALFAAAALSGALAALGLLVALLGSARDERVERDLEAQGVGPHGLRAELRMRLLIAGGFGVLVGLLLAVVLTRLAVAGVRAAGTVANPNPPLVTVVPWVALVLWCVVAAAVLVTTSWLATWSLVGKRRVHPRPARSAVAAR